MLVYCTFHIDLLNGHQPTESTRKGPQKWKIATKLSPDEPRAGHMHAIAPTGITWGTPQTFLDDYLYGKVP